MSDMEPDPVPIQPLRVGIVGCGRVGETCHLPALHSLGERVRVVAVADVDERRRQRVARLLGINQAFPDVDSMLSQTAVPLDAVVVCTPAEHHADAVIRALEAGKHVLVEKPLALTLDDADRIAACAEAFGHLKVMVGFNLRHHRLVHKARHLLAQGAIGDVQVVRTMWTSGIRHRRTLPAWRNSRQTGGGVLSEIAVHHIDLLRYLTGAEVMEVFAASRHGDSDDQSAVLTLRLSSDAVASCVFSEQVGDANELEFLGPKGRLAFSIYRFDSLTFTPTGSYGGRLGHMIRTLKDVPEVWPILRRGGDFRETYRQEWLAFLDAVRHGAPVTATAEDGQQALRAVLAAGASANAGKPVSINEAPREPEPVAASDAARAGGLSLCRGQLAARAVSPPGQARADRQQAVGQQAVMPPVAQGRMAEETGTLAAGSGHLARDAEAPQFSAVIATRGSFAAIRRTVRHLRAQTVQDQMELLIVCPSQRELGVAAEELDGFWGWRVVEVGPIRSIARANAAGVRAAAAPLVVLCEDHAFPDPRWAEALITAHRGPYAVVGPAVRNANPGTTVSWADCLIGYGPWLEPIPPGEPSHLPGHNSSYKREILLGYGDRLEEMMEAETVLQWDLRAQGHSLYLEPAARLAHTNFALWGIWTRVQFHAGRMFAATRALGWPAWKRALFVGASPLIPLVRLKRIWGHARRVGGDHGLLLRILPALFWGLVLDGLGQMAGYAAGAGRSAQKIAQYEFERVRYITEQDRQRLGAAAELAAQS